jgi:serine/threonine protein kinase
MTQPSVSPSSFTVNCPGCGRKLRFTVDAQTPGRLRIQCSSCGKVFGVRRPGADATQLSMTGEMPPTLVGMPVPAPTQAIPQAATGPLPSRTDGSVLTFSRGRGDMPAFAPDELIAERYRVVRFIARGGMGEVYEVEDLVLRDRVALKTVRAEVAADGMAVERFKREIHLARKVTHPNVCRIFDISPQQPFFLTMELLAGETLSERLRRAGPLSPDEALPIVRQIADGLHAAHQAGVVHRDLKPGNVMLVESRGALRAVVTDFGLARLESGEDHRGLTLTTAGVVGTPAYLAPEQIEGKEITPAVDIYALGIVIYEMLTGTVPFIGDNALSTAVKRLQHAPASPRVHMPGLDARWEAAILRCLERDPAGRFATAPDIAHAIARGTTVEMRRPEPPAPPPPQVPAAQPARRRTRSGGARSRSWPRSSSSASSSAGTATTTGGRARWSRSSASPC